MPISPKYFKLSEMEGRDLPELSDLEALPDEIQFKIALEMRPEDILNLCKSSRALSRMCASNYFWRQKLLKDFGIRTRHNNALGYYRAMFDGYTEFRKGNLELIVADSVVLTLILNNGDTYRYFPEMEEAIEVDAIMGGGPSIQNYQQTPEIDGGTSYKQQYYWEENVESSQIEDIIKYAFDNGFTITFQD